MRALCTFFRSPLGVRFIAPRWWMMDVVCVLGLGRLVCRANISVAGGFALVHATFVWRRFDAGASILLGADSGSANTSSSLISLFFVVVFFLSHFLSYLSPLLPFTLLPRTDADPVSLDPLPFPLPSHCLPHRPRAAPLVVPRLRCAPHGHSQARLWEKMSACGLAQRGGERYKDVRQRVPRISLHTPMPTPTPPNPKPRPGSALRRLRARGIAEPRALRPRGVAEP
ncbi:hypothetical protein B0H10DRAFT_150995 [Mycena sp. CBHHK59/15]|nr:hypothetical protein B0H10DRAFT_150995 [Mycena sp. CBHHK59/15]